MTIKTTDILELLTKAGELDLSIFVRQDDDGDYIIKFYDLYNRYAPNFEETIQINSETESEKWYWGKGTCSFECLMDNFVDMLKQKEEAKIKAQKRKELLAKLTDEEKELLDLKK